MNNSINLGAAPNISSTTKRQPALAFNNTPKKSPSTPAPKKTTFVTFSASVPISIDNEVNDIVSKLYGINRNINKKDVVAKFIQYSIDAFNEGKIKFEGCEEEEGG